MSECKRVTTARIVSDWTRPSMQTIHGLDIPAGTALEAAPVNGDGSGAGEYWICGLDWIPAWDTMLRHDANHYGIRVASDMGSLVRAREAAQNA